MEEWLTATRRVVEFEEAQASRRRRRYRIWLPITVVVLILAALIAIAVYDYRAMRADALSLSEGVVTNLQSRIETEVASHLAPIPGIVRFARELLAGDDLLSTSPEIAENIAIGILKQTPQLTSLILGKRTGEFFMVRRYLDGGKPILETKIIRRPDGSTGDPPMRIRRRDAAGEILFDGPVPWDGYDPRDRLWFVGAVQSRDFYWTDVYPFFTSRAAGITASSPHLDEQGQVAAVVGADVELQSLSRMLAGLSIGKTGLAVIVDDAGRLIAHPNQAPLIEDAEGNLHLRRIADIDDAVLNRAFDRYRVEGRGRRDFEIDGRRYISSASSLGYLLQRDWSILVVVPESDFVGFVVENVRNTLLMGIGIVALAGLLAAFVVRQGLRADREAIEVLERQAQLDAQAAAFARLASQPNEQGEQHVASLEDLSEGVANATGVRRVSIWKTSEKDDSLLCRECYDKAYGGHTEGAMLRRTDHAGLFRLLPEVILRGVENQDDGDLMSLRRSYLSPLGCNALLSVPLVVQGQCTGALWLEDRRDDPWPEHVQRFAQAVANLMAAREAAGLAPAAAQPLAAAAAAEKPLRAAAHRLDPARPKEIDRDLGLDRSTVFADRLARQAGSDNLQDLQVIEQLAVVSLHFTDALALAQPAADGRGEATLAYLIGRIEAAADQHGIGYLRILTDEVVAAIPARDAGEPTAGVAEFALAAQAACEELFAEHHVPLVFALGMDLGPAVGVLLGRERRFFNLWGEALESARSMADSAPPGGIQTTESLYRALHDRYLFQVRGHHFLEGVGEFSTYLLSGRL